MKISTQAKLISTALAAVAIAAPIAHGESDGTLLFRASQKAAAASSGSYPRLKTGEGFSFEVPSYRLAGPSYWSTEQAPPVRMNRSLEVPPQYLGTGIQTQARTPEVSMNRSLGVPPVYLGAGTQIVPAAPDVSMNRSLGVPPQLLGAGTSEQVSTASTGFDWLDAGVGAAFVAGMGALGLAVFVVVRRRHGLALPEV
jgi:hypothetical protein